MDERRWRYPPVQAGALIAETVGLVRRYAVPLWPIWLAMFGVTIASAEVSRAIMRPDLVVPFGPWLLSVIGYGVVAAVLYGAAMRTLLGARAWRWRRDDGLAAYVLINLGFAMVHLLPARLLADLAGASIAEPATEQWATYMIGAAIWWLTLWPFSRLMLWPLGRLMGEGRMTARASWIAMRGAVGPYVLAYLVISAPLYVLHELAWEQFWYGARWAGLLIGSALGVAWDALDCALAAAVYRARVQEAEALEEVFA